MTNIRAHALRSMQHTRRCLQWRLPSMGSCNFHVPMICAPVMGSKGSAVANFLEFPLTMLRFSRYCSYIFSGARASIRFSGTLVIVLSNMEFKINLVLQKKCRLTRLTPGTWYGASTLFIAGTGHWICFHLDRRFSRGPISAINGRLHTWERLYTTTKVHTHPNCANNESENATQTTPLHAWRIY